MNTFLEPCTRQQRIIKWTVIALVILLGVGMFLMNLENVLAFENACENPIYVEATISVVREGFITPAYWQTLSYDYGGTHYQNIPYLVNQNEYALQKDGTVITVSVNPDNPSQLVSKMLNDFPFAFSRVILSLGLALQLYGIAIEFEPFRNWRLTRARRRDDRAMNPDYPKDVFIVFIAIFFVYSLILALLFPHTMGLAGILKSF